MFTIPSRFLSAFRTSTLRQLEGVAKKIEVRKPLFFRSAYTAYVRENERRSFQPIIVVDSTRVAQWRCSCSEQLRHGDLCRHLALVLAHASSEDGSLLNERYEASFWRSIGFESFSGGRTMEETPPDQRELLLRRYVITGQEEELLRRGAGSTRLKWESSPWYRWSKEQFLRFGNAPDAKLSVQGGEATLEVGEESLGVPRSAVEAIVAAGAAGGFTIDREALTPSLRVEFTPERTLKFTPVLIARDGTVHERAGLERFGRYFLFHGAFATLRDMPPLFIDAPAAGQRSLFEERPRSGLPYDRETVIQGTDAFHFLVRHKAQLAALPDGCAPDAIRRPRMLEASDEVVFDFAPTAGDQLDVAITLRAGGVSITAAELGQARKKKVHLFLRDGVWIDLDDPQFAWLESARFAGERLLLTKLEYLRIRSLIRGRAVFRGAGSQESVFRLFDDLHNADNAPTPQDLGMDLYGYQQTGYHWLWLLQQNGFGGLLCDDMGLGKTHQAMALIRAMTRVEAAVRTLVVCPTSVLDHWREKLSRYLPDVPLAVHHGTGRELRDDARIVLTSYGVVRSDLEHFRARPFELLIVDEIQTIKNAGTATHQALRAIDRRHAIGLTGTPVENHERELHTLVDFVVPGYLPESVADRATLRRLVTPFVLRRTKAQVLTELPPKIVDKRYCELTPEQRSIYRSVIESHGRPLRAQLASGARIPYIHVFAALNYLKQICNHPATLRGPLAADVPSGKWELFTELLEECMTSGLKVVVFSQYLAMLQMIEKHLASRDIGFAGVTGSTRERGAEVRRFQTDPQCRVFTASLRAAGVGIDLTSASVVIHYDRWWNQAREDQATDRVHRLGQTNGVQVIKLITRGTLEEKIDAIVERKAMLSADLIQTDDPSLVKQFTPQELDQLLGWEE